MSASAPEPERYTLDTSAVIAYLANEPGAERVQDLLGRAERREVHVYASFMTYMEVLYSVWRKLGEQAGKAAYLRLKALAVEAFEPSEELLLAAARLKATHDLSVADAWIGATALVTRSHLVHKDPEFRPLAGTISLLELPRGPARRAAPRARG